MPLSTSLMVDICSDQHDKPECARRRSGAFMSVKTLMLFGQPISVTPHAHKEEELMS